MFDKKTPRIFGSLAAMVLLFGIAVAVFPEKTVLAGSNGQQIQFSCSNTPFNTPSMNWVVVKGTNQYGQSAMWEGPVLRGTGFTYIVTRGWWWVGNARIYWRSALNGQWDSMPVTVPKIQSGDIAYFQCPTKLW